MNATVFDLGAVKHNDEHQHNVSYHFPLKLYSILFWIEVSTSGTGYLMTSRTDGTMIRPFFTSTQRKRYLFL